MPNFSRPRNTCFLNPIFVNIPFERFYSLQKAIESDFVFSRYLNPNLTLHDLTIWVQKSAWWLTLNAKGLIFKGSSSFPKIP